MTLYCAAPADSATSASARRAGTCVILLVQDLHITVVNAITGSALRELIFNPPNASSVVIDSLLARRP